jgi:tetratricopeptide (TPR) repeat protein
MRRIFTPIGILLLSGLGLTAVLALLLVGSVRYGGPMEFWLQVQAKIAARQSHPEFVPTPLMVRAADAVEAAEASSTWLASPTPRLRSEAAVMIAPGPTPAPAQAQATALTPTPAIVPAHALAMALIAPTPALGPLPTMAPIGATFKAAAPAVELPGVTHVWQTWNNCGPATLSMDFSFWGRQETQADIGQVLKGNRDDKNVNPDELAAYARGQGFQALVRVNGSLDRLRLLLSNGLPVLVETWLEEEPNNGMGHYRLLTAYDDAAQQWRLYDSFVSKGIDAKNYRGIPLSSADLDRLWAVFNRTYVLIYPADRAPIVDGILGDDARDEAMWPRALAAAQTAVRERPKDAFAWFDLGSDWVGLSRYEDAAAAFDRARVLGLPWRMLWYQYGPFRAAYETGRYPELIALADATIKTKGNVEEIFYWKALALTAQGDAAGARLAWQQVVALNPRFSAVLAALDWPVPPPALPALPTVAARS